jgi:NADH-quinone oxidoreductase subunit G
MSDDTVTIEVDGKTLQARKGQMLIEVTDANDIYVPRFCYHEKLTIAANCRMCLVEVEKAPKPLPACATPVMDGMKVQTRSNYAKEAQKSVMEFLLINHPLDCPICDQGGECELQDLAMGYGSDVSRYQERKRVVKDKNIGPLVQTEMTRCIHCTRCVRFGEEIAGLRELGATGRGENVEIGTYIEKSMVSELSGNVIDVCPVGALTSKPFRFSARTWEMTQQPGIAPHDALGSNIHFHVKCDVVKRVVPAQNEDVNEVWLSDRDRFSYEGLYSDQRLTSPMIKQDGEWKEVDWSVAFESVTKNLKDAATTDPGSIAALVSPTCTTEEAYLLQRILRGLGTNNIDHRIHQGDFSDQDHDPLYPSLGQSVADLQDLGAALIVGGNPRKQQPLLNLRLRKAALKGAAISVLNIVEYDFNYHLATSIIVSPTRLVSDLAAILKAVADKTGKNQGLPGFINGLQVSDSHQAIADQLVDADKASVLAGNALTSHPEYSSLRYLAAKIAELSSSTFGFMGEYANEAGCCVAGALPHRGFAGQKVEAAGLNALDMFEKPLSNYIIYNLDPQLDLWNGHKVMETLGQAGSVISCSAYRTPALDAVATVYLPIAIYAENEGSFINLNGTNQSFSACVPPRGEARPGWKILRVLANHLQINKFDYESVADITNELNDITQNLTNSNLGPFAEPVLNNYPGIDVTRITDMTMNSVDMLVRHAVSLQQTQDIADDKVHLNQTMAEKIGLVNGAKVLVEQSGVFLQLDYIIDNRLPENTILLHAAGSQTSSLGAWYDNVTIRKA